MKKNEKLSWGVREYILLLFPLLILSSKWWPAWPIIKSTYGSGVITICIQTVATITVFCLYKKMLAEHWSKYKSRLWLKLLLAAGCVAVMYLILGVCRKLPFMVNAVNAVNAASAAGDSHSQAPVWFSVLAALVPLQAPFIEEMLFRHNLFLRFQKKPPVALIMCIISAVLFGAIHIHNFSGNLVLTIPYMAVGLFLNIVYLFGKNIWYTMIPHIIFNAIGGILPALLMLILEALGVNVGG